MQYILFPSQTCEVTLSRFGEYVRKLFYTYKIEIFYLSFLSWQVWWEASTAAGYHHSGKDAPPSDTAFLCDAV